MDKVCFGVPSYGSQPPDWWVPFVNQVGILHKYDIDYQGVLHAGSMMVDKNRTKIAYQFLDTEAEWLFWVDADNINPIPALRKLLDTAGDGKTLVSGLYFLKSESPYPVAYMKRPDGRYDALQNWDRGEIVGADAAGMNCLLVHRDAFEDYLEDYIALQLAQGGLIAVNREDIVGDIWPEMTSENDGKVVEGIYNLRVWPPLDEVAVPFFEIGHQRTEDFGFFERMARCGHKLWIDTSVECGHLTWKSVDGSHYRKFINMVKDGLKKVKRG